MWNPLRILLVPVAAALALAACGSDSGSSLDSGAATTAATTAPATLPSTLPGTTVAGGTAAPESTTAVTDQPTSEPVEIIVNVDDPAQVGQTFPVALGQTVILRLVSDSDQEYHVHGFELEQQVAAGVEATFEFTADVPGSFDVESHTNDAVLAIIQVV
ncbi:MAG TPA: hypothetical protein VFP08_01675 [Acidimicrobiales bacterium]|nr:hypothetical protein [Acidimicrobiales bacterium]